MLYYREEIAKYDKLKKNYVDPTYEVVSSIFRALAGKKIIGSGSFQRSVYPFPDIYIYAYLNLSLSVARAIQASKPILKQCRETSSCLSATSSLYPNSLF